jgi:hypothetical protein
MSKAVVATGVRMMGTRCRLRAGLRRGDADDDRYRRAIPVTRGARRIA